MSDARIFPELYRWMCFIGAWVLLLDGKEESSLLLLAANFILHCQSLAARDAGQ